MKLASLKAANGGISHPEVGYDFLFVLIVTQWGVDASQKHDGRPLSITPLRVGVWLGV